MQATISLGQMDVILGEPARNLEKARAFAAQAAARGSDVLVLPELWSTAYDLERADMHATAPDEGTFAAVAELALEHRVYIIGSLLGKMPDGGVGNTAVLFSPEGQGLATYSKIHLFRLMDEEQYLTAGNKLALAETPWG
ncbi:MAG: nitrilase-related carbon-nitrogen hydrolase, partial [Anaerolineae bacterium]|nr:nitrilase-related carbon-nitrogen hydrolase [Anaerolineae bacterium]